MQMKLWTLAAGLLAIPVLSDAMIWMAPPPEPVTITFSQNAGTAGGYDLVEVDRLNKLVARKLSESERATALKERQAKVLAEVYGVTPGNADSFREWW